METRVEYGLLEFDSNLNLRSNDLMTVGSHRFDFDLKYNNANYSSIKSPFVASKLPVTIAPKKVKPGIVTNTSYNDTLVGSMHTDDINGALGPEGRMNAWYTMSLPKTVSELIFGKPVVLVLNLTWRWTSPSPSLPIRRPNWSMEIDVSKFMTTSVLLATRRYTQPHVQQLLAKFWGLVVPYVPTATIGVKLYSEWLGGRDVNNATAVFSVEGYIESSSARVRRVLTSFELVEYADCM